MENTRSAERYDASLQGLLLDDIDFVRMAIGNSVRRNAGLLADQPGLSPDPASVEARALYARIREAVLAGR